MGKRDPVLKVLSPSKPYFHQESFAACADRNSKMKLLLILTALCITLGLCHGACTLIKNTPTVIDGQVISPDGCTDESDGRKHPFGDAWNTANCTRCFCARKGMLCCPRYGLPPVRQGCTARVDPETCQYKLYKTIDLTTPCVA